MATENSKTALGAASHEVVAATSQAMRESVARSEASLENASMSLVQAVAASTEGSENNLAQVSERVSVALTSAAEQAEASLRRASESVARATSEPLATPGTGRFRKRPGRNGESVATNAAEAFTNHSTPSQSQPNTAGPSLAREEDYVTAGAANNRPHEVQVLRTRSNDKDAEDTEKHAGGEKGRKVTRREMSPSPTPCDPAAQATPSKEHMPHESTPHKEL